MALFAPERSIGRCPAAALGNGSTFKELSSEALEQFPLFDPAPAIQGAIVELLDRETAKIDDVLAKNQLLLEGLAEERRARRRESIHFDSREPFPLMRLKYLVKAIIDTEHKTVPFVDCGEYLVVRTTNVRDGRLVFDSAKYTDQAGFEEWTVRGIPSPGDVILTREAPAGEACVVPSGLRVCLQRTVLLK